MSDIKINLVMLLPGRNITQKVRKYRCRRDIKYKKKVKEIKREIKNLKDPCTFAVKVINICEEAYDYFISDSAPLNYSPSKAIRETLHVKQYINKNTGQQIEASNIRNHGWKKLSAKQRLEWHLNKICESNNGILDFYTVFDY